MSERMTRAGDARPFSFIDFYSRRVRRIFPSLMFCLVTFLVLGWFVLLPDEYSLLGKHVSGASAYVSNLLLWSEAGDYFQVSSQTKPLLHLWSLGIEEQFYLIWPLVLFIAWKLNLNILTLALLGAVASFGFELHSVRSNPTAAFYSPFLRFWELMAGSILAWLKLYKSEMFVRLADMMTPYLSRVLLRDSSNVNSIRLCCSILSVLGLISILIGIFALNSKHFPGSKALYPVLGAVMMIAAGKDAFLNRYFLSNRVMVWFGLISYPLYIWHWPFLSFAWIVGGEMPELRVRIGCVVLAVIMSAVTYYFVEPGLRWGRYGGYKAAGLLSCMIVIGVTGYSIMRHDGYTARMNDPEQQMIDAMNKRLEDDNQRCLKELPEWNKIAVSNVCRFQRDAGKNTIAVIGDSHAGHLYPGLITRAADKEGIAVFPAGCATPLIGLQSGRANSEYLLSKGFKYILNHKNLTKVVLAHNPACSWLRAVDVQNPFNHDFASILHDGFSRTYDTLTKAGKEIYVVLDNPGYSSDTWEKCKSSVVRRPSAIPDFLISRNTKICSEKSSQRLDSEAVQNWNKVSRDLAAGYKNIHFIDLEQAFCNNGICSMLDGNMNMLYQDFHHLNAYGSIYAARFILAQLAGNE